MSDVLIPTAVPAFEGEVDTTGVDTTVKRRRKRPIFVMICASWIGFVVLLALIADFLPIKGPNADAHVGVRVPPFHLWSEPFGTDNFGRSELSRLIYGARVSLFASVLATAIAMLIGLLIGVTAGYFRGTVDSILGLVVDSMLAFPGLVLLLALSAVLKPGLSTVVIGLSIIASISFARLARAATLKVGSAEYVTAARGLGARSPSVLLREIVPNVASGLIAYAGVVIGGLILAEAALSFLGLGVQPPTASWGNMVAEGQPQLSTEPWLIMVPIVVLFLTIFSLNIVGDWIRRRSDAAARI
jgi:peptide/nickel transport system permease protein